MVTSPINPMRYWKLEEIQSMLNEIEGYENVVVEFKYAPSNGWNSDHWDCKCGIKEQLVNGEWNWLLKYEFQINDKLELADVRLAAFQEMAERLVRDVWRTSINSFRNEQKQNKTLSENDLKLIDEIDKTYKTGKYKTNKMNILSRLNNNDTKAWVMSVTGIITISALIYVIAHYETTIWVLLGICAVAMFGVLAFSVKELIKIYLFNDFE